MDAESQKFSGYDLAYRIFTEAGDDPVSAYIDLVGDETSWLEFKAGMYARENDREKGENEDDNFWHISKAIFAMLNSAGGVVVIGVQDGTFVPVALSDNYPHHIFEQGLDAYLRLAVEKNLPPERKKWKTWNRGIWQADTPIPSGHICIEHARYKDRDIVLVFVKPLDDCQTIQHGNDEVMLVRSPNALGRVAELKSFGEMRDWERNRCIRDEKFNALYGRFLQRQVELDATNVLNAKIAAYYENLRKENDFLLSAFTPLDAQESHILQSDVDAFYSPEAVELKEDPESWLRDDDEEDDEREPDLDEERDDDEFSSGEFLGEDSESNDDEDDQEDVLEVRRGDLLSLLEDIPRIVVSGEPGGGKTTCLTNYALRFQEPRDGVQRLAILVKMGSWRLGGSLEAMMVNATGLDYAQLKSLIDANRVRLVIDAVNECPEAFRPAAILNINHYLLSHPSIPTVLSTRHPKELAGLSFPVFHVQPMDEVHRKHYLERYLGDSTQAEKLLTQIGTMPGGETIAENPMLLRLVVEVYQDAPDKRLPRGRAGLYRRSLKSWYKREEKTAKDSGFALSFGRREALALLAELAFKSRMDGFRDIPYDEVEKIWGASTDSRINQICQGPIVYRVADSIRFRHETFQEYLSAEFLEKHPQALAELCHDDYGRWGMAVAYLVELFETDKLPLPESVWIMAWNLNYWMGVALTDEQRALKLLRPKYPERRPLIFGKELGTRAGNEIVGKLYLDAATHRLSGQFLVKALHYARYPWYSRHDMPLRYVVTVSEKCQKLWEKFERAQLSSLRGLWVKYAIQLAKSWILLGNPRDIFQYHAPDDWERWISEATPEMAMDMIAAKIAIPSDFTVVKSGWIETLSPESGVYFFNSGLLSKVDLAPRIPSWLSQSSLKMTLIMLNCGLIEKSDLPPEKVSQWIQHVNTSSVCELVENGLAKMADFQSYVSKWLTKPTVSKIVAMKRLHVDDKMLCDAIAKMLHKASPDVACEMIDFGLATPEDFHSKIQEWFTKPQYLSLQRFLRRHGDSKFQQAVREHMAFLLDHASVQSAMQMVEDKIATKEDFGERFRAVSIFCPPSLQLQMRKMGLLSDEDMDSIRTQRESISQHSVGDVIEGRIAVLTEHGAIVSFNGVYGLLKSKDISWGTGCVTNDSLSVSQDVRCKILSLESESGRVYLGIKQLQDNPWNHVEERYAVASRVHGKVVNVSLAEAVVELEPGIEGLVQLSELSWKRIKKASDVLNVGDEVEAVVLSVEKNQAHISLSIRQVCRNPWDYVETRYSVGSQVHGKVVTLVPFGAFVELEPGIEGLVHVSEFSWTKRMARASDVLQIGDEVDVVVLSINSAEQKIALSIRQTQPNPWDSVPDRYPVGSRVKGKVHNFTSYGAFIEIEPGIDGMIHVSDMSWTRKTSHPSEMLQKGQEVEAVVLEVDSENERIALGLKQTSDEPWHTASSCYQVGQLVKGKVSYVCTISAIIEFDPIIYGMVDISQIESNSVQKVNNALVVGQEVEARIISIDNLRQRIALSIKAVNMGPEEFNALVEAQKSEQSS